MRQLTIPLDDQSAARLHEPAQQRGETLEQTAHALLLAALQTALPTAAPSAPTAPTAPAAPRLAPDDPDGSKAVRALAGTVHYPGATGTVNTTNEEIDRMLADEAMNPHVDD